MLQNLRLSLCTVYVAAFKVCIASGQHQVVVLGTMVVVSVCENDVFACSCCILERRFVVDTSERYWILVVM
jgi:hypothetical protein